jgi:pantoate--beta-alanine ligase
LLILEASAETMATCRAWKRGGARVGFVPTMGYLHEGHISLVRIAKESCDKVVASIFVNPTQFGPNEDFARYPRDLKRDAAMCEAAGVDLLFVPPVEEIYPVGSATFVNVEGPITSTLCGASRPGHFRGVATVVAKLFGIVGPDVAVFGQKDAQQLLVIRRMTRDLFFPVEIVAGPIVRESDGLAMSSRNAYLGPDERAQATVLWRSLQEAARMFEGGERRASKIVAKAREIIGFSPLARPDYVELVDNETLLPVQGNIDGTALLALAVFFGKTRLIDNAVLQGKESR